MLMSSLWYAGFVLVAVFTLFGKYVDLACSKAVSRYSV